MAIIINYHPPLDYTSKRRSCCDNSTLPSLLSQSLSQLICRQLVCQSGVASQYLFQLSQPVGLLLEVSQTLGKVFNQPVILSVLLSVIPSASPGGVLGISSDDPSIKFFGFEIFDSGVFLGTKIWLG